MVIIDSLGQFDRLQISVIANQSIKDILEDRCIAILAQICRRALSTFTIFNISTTTT